MPKTITYCEKIVFAHFTGHIEGGENFDVYEPLKMQAASNGLAYYLWEPLGHYVIFQQNSGECAIPQVIELTTPEQCQRVIAGMDALGDWYLPFEQIKKPGQRAMIEAILREAGIALPNGLYGTEEASVEEP